MSENSYSISSINPWRMMLFGSLGVLIPLTFYILLLEFMPTDLKRALDTFIGYLFIITLILSFIGGYFGFKYSSHKLELKVDENGLTETIVSNLSFLPVRKLAVPWNKVLNHSITEDSKGKILEINLHNNKKITIGIAYILNDSKNFDNFYSAFLKHINNFNTQHFNSQSSEIPIRRSPDFYQSKLGQVLAYFLIILMVGVIILLIISAKKLNYWVWMRLLFFETIAGYYVWRSLFGKD